jgi:hypothetical protein
LNGDFGLEGHHLTAALQRIDELLHAIESLDRIVVGEVEAELLERLDLAPWYSQSPPGKRRAQSDEDHHHAGNS